jgi:hypothetical protein
MPRTTDKTLASPLSIVTGEPNARGSISSLRLNGVEKFLVLETKAGQVRGGERCPADKYVMALEGVSYWLIGEPGKGTLTEAKINVPMLIHANVPHLNMALTDSWMLRWFPGEPRDNIYVPELRVYVEDEMKKAELYEMILRRYDSS